jgi:hypothetical protein
LPVIIRRRFQIRESPGVETLLLLAVGILIGWNIPQPDWAREAQEKVMALFRNKSDRG